MKKKQDVRTDRTVFKCDEKIRSNPYPLAWQAFQSLHNPLRYARVAVFAVKINQQTSLSGQASIFISTTPWKQVQVRHPLLKRCKNILPSPLACGQLLFEIPRYCIELLQERMHCKLFYYENIIMTPMPSPRRQKESFLKKQTLFQPVFNSRRLLYTYLVVTTIPCQYPTSYLSKLHPITSIPRSRPGRNIYICFMFK